MESLHQVFIDKNGVIRSGWRAGIFLFAFAVIVTLVATVIEATIQLTATEVPQGSNTWLSISALISLIAAILGGWICGRWLENLPFRTLGAAFTNGWFKHLVLGLVIGAITLSFAVLIAFVFGGERFHLNLANGGENVAYSLLISFFVFAVGASWEEAFFRGYILQTFERSNLAWLAIVLTSVFFGVGHVRNPNAGVISTLNTILAGLWFSVAYLKTRDLWFVWGLHLMWNWMQGSFFGIEVSGLTDITTNPLLREIDTGPTWLTGTTYGIEGGIACTAALIASIAALQFGKKINAETAKDAEI